MNIGHSSVALTCSLAWVEQENCDLTLGCKEIPWKTAGTAKQLKLKQFLMHVIL